MGRHAFLALERVLLETFSAMQLALCMAWTVHGLDQCALASTSRLWPWPFTTDTAALAKPRSSVSGAAGGSGSVASACART